MAAHLTGDANGPPPPGRNEVLLREAVDRLRRELDECRSIIALHQQNGCGTQLYVEGRQVDAVRDAVEFVRKAAGYFHGSTHGDAAAAIVAAYDKAMGGR